MKRRLSPAERYELAAHLAIELHPMNAEKCRKFVEKRLKEATSESDEV